MLWVYTKMKWHVTNQQKRLQVSRGILSGNYGERFDVTCRNYSLTWLEAYTGVCVYVKDERAAGADKDRSFGGMGRKHRIPPQHCDHHKAGRDHAQAGKTVSANCSLSDMMGRLTKKNIFFIFLLFPTINWILGTCNEGRQGAVTLDGNLLWILVSVQPLTSFIVSVRLNRTTAEDRTTCCFYVFYSWGTVSVHSLIYFSLAFLLIPNKM